MGRLKDNWKLIVSSSVVTLVVIILAVETDKYLGSDSFCLSCHSMSYNAQELKESSHFGAMGVNPHCGDCHLPPELIKRTESHIVDGTRALIGEFKNDLSTKENFDKHRAEFAHNARMSMKRWNDSPCRVCHKDVRPSSDDAARQHKRMESEGLTCIDCHQNLVHEEVPEEDLVRGMKEGKIVLKEKK